MVFHLYGSYRVYIYIQGSKFQIMEYLLHSGEMSTRQEVGVINVKYHCHKAARTLNVTQKSSLADETVIGSGLKIVPLSLYST